MVIIILLTLAALAVQLIFSGILLIANLGNLGLSLVPWTFLIMGAILAAWLIRD